MWLCNLFTILVCLTSVDNFDAVQEARYGKLIDPPRESILDENNTAKPAESTPQIPPETTNSDSNP